MQMLMRLEAHLEYGTMFKREGPDISERTYCKNKNGNNNN